MDDDVIRGATIAHAGLVTFHHHRQKYKQLPQSQKRWHEKTPEELRAEEVASLKADQKSGVLIGMWYPLLLLVGTFAPASFMQHFIVFVLAVFVGFQVIWNVSHSAHAINGGHKCNFLNYHSWSCAANWVNQ